MESVAVHCGRGQGLSHLLLHQIHQVCQLHLLHQIHRLYQLHLYRIHRLHQLLHRPMHLMVRMGSFIVVNIKSSFAQTIFKML